MDDSNIVYFVTKNKHDFNDNNDKEKLHPDLIKDLNDSHIDQTRLVIFNELSMLLNDVIAVELKSIDEIKKQLQSNSWPFLSHSEIEEAISDLISNKSIEYPLPSNDNTDAYVNWISEISINKIEEIKRINDEEIFIQLNCECNIDFEYFVYKFDYYAEENPEYTVEDIDWNDHYAQVSINREVEFNFIFIFNINEKKIKEIEYNTLSSDIERW